MKKIAMLLIDLGTWLLIKSDKMAKTRRKMLLRQAQISRHEA